MKNKISILILLLAIAIPQVVSASWWNPFSWFKNKSPQIQTITEVKTTPTSTTLYVKSDNTRIRICASIGCDILGYYSQNSKVIVSAGYTLDTLSEWVELNFPDGKQGYVHKSTLSDKLIEKTEPQTNGFVPYKPEPKNSLEKSNKNSFWDNTELPNDQIDPNSKLCNGEYWDPCSGSQIFVCPTSGDPVCMASDSKLCNGKYYSPCSVGNTFTCPVSGDAYCLTPIQQQKNTQIVPPNTTLCNGINWSKCPVGQDFVCPATGDAYCQRPPMQSMPPASQQTQTQISTEDTAKANEIKSLKAQLVELQTQAKTIEAERNQGVTNIQDQPIAMSFITGQSAALERQINAKLQTNAAQQSAIITKIATLEGISLPPPLITTSSQTISPTYVNTGGNIQCSWFNDIWRCSSSSGTGTNTNCSWFGDIWKCSSY